MELKFFFIQLKIQTTMVFQKIENNKIKKIYEKPKNIYLIML